MRGSAGGEWWKDHPGGQNELVLVPGREPGSSAWRALQRRWPVPRSAVLLEERGT